MATRIGNPVFPSEPPVDNCSSPTNDVWIPMNESIRSWGLGCGQDLFDRLIGRQEELLSVGAVQSRLYQQFNFGVPCPCIKSETKQVDQRCPACYGSLFFGGYELYGHNTITLSGEYSTVGGVIQDGRMGGTIGAIPTLNNIIINQLFGRQAELAKDALTGTILSPIFQVDNSFGLKGFRLDGADGIRLPNTKNNIKVEFTVDGGVTFKDINTEGETCLGEPLFNVQFRITLSRNALTEPTPILKSLRVRFQCAEKTTILISKNTFPEQRVLESFGVRVGATGITWWTTPSMGVRGGPVTFIQENDIFEIIEGHYKEQSNATSDYPISGRFKPSNVSYVEPTGKLISQRFNIRLLQKDEPGFSVF